VHHVPAAGQPAQHRTRLRGIGGLSERFAVEVDDGVGGDDEPFRRCRTARFPARVAERRLGGIEARQRPLVVGARDHGDMQTKRRE